VKDKSKGLNKDEFKGLNKDVLEGLYWANNWSEQRRIREPVLGESFIKLFTTIAYATGRKLLQQDYLKTPYLRL
jgi:hypothetical protein